MKGTSDNTGKADAARKTAHQMTQKADWEMKLGGDGESILTELLLKLAVLGKGSGR